MRILFRVITCLIFLSAWAALSVGLLYWATNGDMTAQLDWLNDIGVRVLSVGIFFLASYLNYYVIREKQEPQFASTAILAATYLYIIFGLVCPAAYNSSSPILFSTISTMVIMTGLLFGFMIVGALINEKFKEKE